MVFTEEAGKRVDVMCCAAWSFSTSFMMSVKVCGPFSYTLVAIVCAFFKPLRKILIVEASLLNLHLLAYCLNV